MRVCPHARRHGRDGWAYLWLVALTDGDVAVPAAGGGAAVEEDLGPLTVSRAVALSTGYGSFTRVAWLCSDHGGTGGDASKLTGYMLAAPSPDSECEQITVVQRAEAPAAPAGAAPPRPAFEVLGVIDMAVPREYLKRAASHGGGGDGGDSDDASSITSLLKGKTGEMAVTSAATISAARRRLRPPKLVSMLGCPRTHRRFDWWSCIPACPLHAVAQYCAYRHHHGAGSGRRATFCRCRWTVPPRD